MPMKCKTIRLDVNIPGTVIGVPRVIESPEFGFVSGARRQQIGFECLLGQLLDAVQPPNVIVLVVEDLVPLLAHERAILQIRER